MNKLRHVMLGLSVLALVLVAVAGFAGYRIMSGNKSTSPTAQTITSSAAIPNKIQSKADVRQASRALDNGQADKKLDPAQLDGDITSLL